ncbi:DEAD/DEAH box helicase [Pelagicoccus enzymogenes]|uniref:DEAD/DEAH box helicase n=1 Tax=Pelagicoccus enzymogenes TaxID=2773457 RepID=UPI00280EC04E|nr:DEAD/DEAH box helicase [Pelagicoccus enzymogenes]MDQ8200715.1 DEAD/DEAH box helicase [Pelagicoccus enzymogenes]
MLPLPDTAFERFHPLVARWFTDELGEPTDIQRKAWRLISAGEHCLISAATGSGKTLASFLWAISQLASGEWELGQTRVLYVSPLKALNNDIRRNLLGPLEALRELFEEEGVAWPEIRVMTRSGDTQQGDRRKMLRHPPEILITTPESLNLLLTSKDGQRSLQGIRSVVIDEVHSVVGSKRGVYLMTAVERLAHLCGEFQRIALSATVRPMELVASYIGGYKDGVPRTVARARSEASKSYEISVRFPAEANEDANDDDFWRPIVQDLKVLVSENRSTLIFVNSRKLCEKLAYKINRDEPAPIAYSHHGSLSKEIRFAVEQRLKKGELKAIVATNSLEMGIDVGALDCVVMVQCPGQISSAVQKVGRAGHQVGAISRAVVFPSHSRDFLESAVLSQSIQERAIEAVHPVEAPLDVLAQVLVSMLGSGPQEIDALFSLVRNAYPYRSLSREVFDLVLNMQAGRYAGSRLRELKARIAIDREANTATLRKGALMAFYFSGGVIPDRGYFHLRHSGNGGRIGELDEEFVWERKIGEVFTLGVQSWRIDQITYNDVLVSPASGGEEAPPFWRADVFDRDFHFSNRIGEFLEWADERCGSAGFVDELQKRFKMDAVASKALQEFLERQCLATGRGLPHRHHLLAEVIDAAPGGAPGQQLVLHTHWGGRVNRPYALALDAAWSESFGHRTEVYVNNDCVVVMLSDEVSLEEVLGLVSLRNVDTLLRNRLEGSGFFGARFREAAGTSLLITRNKAGQRLPLWLSRMRSKKLFESVQRYDDFPLLLEAWRSCLKDAFDMDSLRLVLGELEQGEISVTMTRGSKASPFASSVAWRQINDEYMYATDSPSGSGRSNLREDLVRSVAFDAENRPQVDEELVHAFEAKRQRLAEGYAPTDGLELKEWLRDRIAIPQREWELFCDRLALGGNVRSPSGPEDDLETARSAAATSGDWVFLKEDKQRFERLFCPVPDVDLLCEFLSYFGPVSIEGLRAWLEASAVELTVLLDSLEDARRIVRGPLLEGEDAEFVCEAENFEILLRMKRARGRAAFQALPLARFGLFLASWQGVARNREQEDGLRDCLDRLLGWTASVSEWEGSLLRSRVDGYSGSKLDALLVEDGTFWYGTKGAGVGFCLPEDWELLRPEEEGDPLTEKEAALLEVLEMGGRFGFSQLADKLSVGAAELEAILWSLVWKGMVSNDAFAAVRKGAHGKFQLCSGGARREQSARSLRLGRRSRASRPIVYPGAWYKLPARVGDLDVVDSLEFEKERARIVLDRYGVVFRELLLREQVGFRWKELFKAFRLLELSGEIVGGRFFEGIPGLQFASKEALRRLKKSLPEKAIYWMSAVDAASLCGIALEELKAALPKRLATTRLLYRGSELVAEAQRGGRVLRFHLEPKDADLTQIVGVMADALGLQALSQLKLESINGEDARSSLYLESLQSVWRLHCDHKQVVVEGVLV